MAGANYQLGRRLVTTVKKHQQQLKSLISHFDSPHDGLPAVADAVSSAATNVRVAQQLLEDLGHRYKTLKHAILEYKPTVSSTPLSFTIAYTQ